MQNRNEVQGWDELVTKYAPLVQNAAFRILGNHDDAEEVTQEVFVEAFSKWSSHSAQNWGGLLRRVAVCRAIDLLRCRRIDEPLSHTVQDEMGSTPSAEAVANETMLRLRRATAELPPREAHVFCMISFEKYSIEETAALLKISNQAVRAALSKSRRKLQRIFLNSRTGAINE